MPTVLTAYEPCPPSTRGPVWTTDYKLTFAEASREAKDKDSDPFPFDDQFSSNSSVAWETLTGINDTGHPRRE